MTPGISIAVLVVLASGPTASPQQILAFGMGGKSCASWQRDPASQAAGRHWIAGFWSGLNAMGESTVGHSTDGEGLLAEVAKVCEAEPSLPLAHAVGKVYIRLRDTQR